MERKRAKRMAPAARRLQILNAAVNLIIADGHAGCSLEQVAQSAGISTPLIYKYFPRREGLLKAILEREFEELNGRGLATIPSDIPIERIIRGTVERALRYYHDRGPILRLLSADPAVAKLAKTGNAASRTSTTDYFVRRFMAYYKVPRDVAVIAVTMVVNAPIHSMHYLHRQEVEIDRTIDVWSEFILGGWQALQARYGETPGQRQQEKQ